MPMGRRVGREKSRFSAKGSAKQRVFGRKHSSGDFYGRTTTTTMTMRDGKEERVMLNGNDNNGTWKFAFGT